MNVAGHHPQENRSLSSGLPTRRRYWGMISRAPSSFLCQPKKRLFCFLYIPMHQLLNPEVLPSFYAISWTYSFDAIPRHCPPFVFLRTIFRSPLYARLPFLLQHFLQVILLYPSLISNNLPSHSQIWDATPKFNISTVMCAHTRLCSKRKKHMTNIFAALPFTAVESLTATATWTIKGWPQVLEHSHFNQVTFSIILSSSYTAFYLQSLVLS